VQLYSKTIRVLTSHSHVLSFKNIKVLTALPSFDLSLILSVDWSSQYPVTHVINSTLYPMVHTYYE
jgi:hypothetical protein